MSLPEAFALACKMAGPLEIRATHRGTGAEQSFKINQPFTVMGRAAGAGVRLEDPSVSQCHAFLQIVEGMPYCIDLGSRTGVVWDDGSQGRGWVHPGQVVRVGAFDLRVGRQSDEGAHAPPTPEDPAESDYRGHMVPFPASLEVHNPGGNAPVYHPLDRPLTLLGRHPSCNLRFLEDAIGYFHCVFVNTSDGVWFVDVLSRKGTLLNGRTTRLARVREGDLIELGKATLVVRTDTHTSAQPLVVNAPVARPAADPSHALQERVAESVAGAFTPFRDMLGQFQQCFMTMAQMFTALQQEQASLLCEQMRHLQELSRELRELRAESRPGSPVPATPAEAEPPQAAPTPTPPAAAVPPAPKPPMPKVAEPADAKALADAHTWFLERLAKMGQPPTPSAKPG
jgi:pSer/pThr/pTyr-binding forkhead associated (FHA) protein